MSTSITERVLGNNNIYIDKYLSETLLLVKSIIVVNHSEAKLYNDLLVSQLGVSVDYSRKETWRYYHHLTGKYHPVDRPMTIVSKDNGTEIILNTDTLDYHRVTKEELLKFDLFYKQVVDKYPDQELLIRSILNGKNPLDSKKVSELDDFSIVSYNQSLVEEQESDVIPTLQERLHNYKVTKLIPYYAMADSLFMASMYAILYNYLLTTIIAIRLERAKTPKAHTFHILNFLASHHNLDRHYAYLTKKQIMFLYRNTLYLNTHVGRNHVFNLLIDVLFTEKKISVVNYRYVQKNSVDDDNYTRYRFKQQLLNKDNLVFDLNDFTLEQLREKEGTLEVSNLKEYDLERSTIDGKLKNSLHAELPTKTLEVTLVDNSNDVKHKLLQIIVDYWAQSINLGTLGYLVPVLDPGTNAEYTLSPEDTFKLFTIVLHSLHGETIDHFPDYRAYRVFKPILPTEEELLSKFHERNFYSEQETRRVLAAIPQYTYCETSYRFNLFIGQVYDVNLGLWLKVTNTHNKDLNDQLELLVENLHQPSTYHQGDESVTSFLRRLGLGEIREYSELALTEMYSDILNAVTYNKLGFLDRNRLVQRSLVEVFKGFTSYSTQLVDRYMSTESILANLKSPLYSISTDVHVLDYYVSNDSFYVDSASIVRSVRPVEIKTTPRATHSVNIDFVLDVSSNYNYIGKQTSYVEVIMDAPTTLNEIDSDWVIQPSDTETLFFLSMNL